MRRIVIVLLSASFALTALLVPTVVLDNNSGTVAAVTIAAPATEFHSITPRADTHQVDVSRNYQRKLVANEKAQKDAVVAAVLKNSQVAHAKAVWRVQGIVGTQRDGVYGPWTFGAVARWQSARCLSRENGYWGAESERANDRGSNFCPPPPPKPVYVAPRPPRPVYAAPRLSRPAPVYAPSSPPGGAAACIRKYESGGNYQAQNPSSTASGAYQFLDASWTGTTGLPGRAMNYSPAIQDAAFIKMWDGGRGAGNWVTAHMCGY